MASENSVADVSPWIVLACEAVAKLRELADVHLVPVLLDLLKGKRPKVPEVRYA